MILSGNQPCYLPSIRLFNRMAHSDIYMHCPKLQFVKKSYHHHNFIKGARLFIPTKSNLGDTILDTQISGVHWIKKHLKAITHAYGSSKYFAHYYPLLYHVYSEREWSSLALLNMRLIELLAFWLDIETKIIDGSQYHFFGDATNKNIQMCQTIGADTYLQSETAKEYQDSERMAAAGIKEMWQQFTLPAYGQDRKTNNGELSALDVLFLRGPEAKQLVYDSWRPE